MMARSVGLTARQVRSRIALRSVRATRRWRQRAIRHAYISLETTWSPLAQPLLPSREKGRPAGQDEGGHKRGASGPPHLRCRAPFSRKGRRAGRVAAPEVQSRSVHAVANGREGGWEASPSKQTRYRFRCVKAHSPSWKNPAALTIIKFLTSRSGCYHRSRVVAVAGCVSHLSFGKRDERTS